MKTRHSSPVTGYLLFVVLLAVAAAGLALTVVSLSPPETIKSRLDALSPDRSADNYPLEMMPKLAGRLQLCGVLLLATGVAGLVCLRPVKDLCSEAVIQTPATLRRWRVQVTRFVRREPGQALGLLLVTAVGAAQRLAALSQPMRADEASTYLLYARHGLKRIVTDYSLPNNHILHTLLSHCSMRLFGPDPWALRLPALVAGILVVPVSYLALRLLWGRVVALPAAALVATSGFLSLHATNARGYSLFVLLVLLTLCCAAVLVRRDRPTLWLLLALLAALGFYTVPVMFYGFGVVAAWLTLSGWLARPPAARGRFLRDLTISLSLGAAVTLLLYLPVLILWGPESLLASHAVQNKTKPFLDAILTNFRRPLEFLELAHLGLPAAAGWTIALLATLGLLLHQRTSRLGVSVVGAGLLWLAPVLLIQRVAPKPRLMQFFLPIYFGLALAGLFYLVNLVPSWRRRVETISLTLAVLSSIGLGAYMIRANVVMDSDDTGRLRDGPALAQYLKEELRAGDRLAAGTESYPQLDYYLRRLGARWKGPEATRRYVVVVNTERGQPLENILRDAGVSAEHLGQPRELHRFPHSVVYAMPVIVGQEH